jgi:hypothetical protein
LEKWLDAEKEAALFLHVFPREPHTRNTGILECDEIEVVHNGGKGLSRRDVLPTE